MTIESKTDRHATRIGLNPDYRRCTHLYSNGRRCADPSLNNRELCFTHHNRRVRVSMKPMPPVNYDRVPLVSFVYAEDLRDIHENWNAALDAWARHSIDIRQLSILDRYFETGRRILRQMESSEKKLARHEAALDAQWDEKGNPHAIDPAQDDTSASSSTVIPSEAERSRGICGCSSDPTPPKPPASETTSASSTTVIPCEAELSRGTCGCFSEPGTLPAVSAEAEDAEDPIPQPHPNQLVKGRNAITRLYSALIGRQKVKRLNSYTYVLEGNRMVALPASERRCRFQASTQRCRIYIQIPKLI